MFVYLFQTLQTSQISGNLSTCVCKCVFFCTQILQTAYFYPLTLVLYIGEESLGQTMTSLNIRVIPPPPRPIRSRLLSVWPFTEMVVRRKVPNQPRIWPINARVLSLKDKKGGEHLLKALNMILLLL